jgi:hypothetical protein
MLKPGQSDKPPSTFWQRLYSTPSLLFLAILTVAIWSANMSALYPSQPRKSAEEILGIQATPRRSAEEILGLTPSPSLTPIPFDEFTKRVGLRATAICADGAYSYSANRRETCSHHGGVAQRLSRQR